MKDKPIFNIKINIGEWDNGPFSNIEQLKLAYQQVSDIKPFLGDFMLIDSKPQELKRGHEKGLHTLVWNMDTGEGPLVHFGSGSTNYLYKQGERIFLEDFLQKHLGGYGWHPCYTLKRLYETLPNQEFMTKVNAIKDELTKHGFTLELERFNQSSEKNKKLDLKLLESYYKKYVSDQ